MPTSSDKKSNWMVYLVSPLFLIAGGFLWGYFSIALFESLRATYTWQQTTAQVADSETTHTSSRMRTGGSTRLSQLNATYTYEVNGQSYTGERVRIFENHSNIDQKYTTELRKQLNTGSVTVYYNPAEPAQSILDPRFTPGHAAMLGWLAVTFMLLGMVVISLAGKLGMAVFYAYMVAAPLVLLAGLVQTLSLGLSFGGVMMMLATLLQLVISRGILRPKKK